MEDISIFEALLIALSGEAIVFLLLGSLAILISVISKVVQAIEQQGQKQVSQAITPATTTPADIEAPLNTQTPSEDKNTPHIYAGEIQLIGVDEKTAVCIMAIVSEETGMDLSEMVFKKIKAL